MTTAISRTLIIVGIFFLGFGGFLLFQHSTPQRLSFKNYKPSSKISEVEQQSRMKIPSLSIDLEIIPSKITNNIWEATSQGVSHLATSPVPGEKGNSILYGHNWTSLLGNLTKIKPGVEINITLKNKGKKTFIVEYVSIVGPNDTQILAETDDNRITLYTCTGFLDSKRFVVSALLKS